MAPPSGRDDIVSARGRKKDSSPASHARIASLFSTLSTVERSRLATRRQILRSVRGTLASDESIVASETP